MTIVTGCPWPVKLCCVASIMLQYSHSQKQLSQEHVLIAVGCVQLLAFAPSLIFSVRNRTDTNFLICQSLYYIAFTMLAKTLTNFTAPQSNAFLLFVVCHLCAWQAQELSNNKRLLNNGEILLWFFSCASFAMPFALAASMPTEYTNMIVFVTTLFAGEIIACCTYALATCARHVAGLYEELWV